MGRPTDYNQEIADIICERIADGESLRSMCKEESMPSKATVFRWLSVHKLFQDQYARAREEQAEAFADEIVSISDEAETTVKSHGNGTTEVTFDSVAIARNRLRIDARKWVASKLKPKKYGEKLDIEHSGNEEKPIITRVELIALNDESTDIPT